MQTAISLRLVADESIQVGSPDLNDDITECDDAQIRSDDPDHDVLRFLVKGDSRSALRLLMQRHGRGVYRYCRTALCDSALAEDVHQQIFIAAYRDLPRFSRRSTVRTWLYAIARHRVLDAAKARRRMRVHLATDEVTTSAEAAKIPDPQPLVTDSIEDKTLQNALIASMNEMDEHAKSLLLLRYQCGLTLEEMSEVYREKPGTLHSRIARGLRQLRGKIESRLGSPL